MQRMHLRRIPLRVTPLVVGGFIALFLTGCGGQQPQASENSAEPEQGDGAVMTEELDDASTALGDAPPTVEPLPPLLPPTNPEQRAAQVASRRSDPFAPLSTAPVILPTVPSAPRSPQQPIPTVPVAALPTVPPAPLSMVPVPLQPAASAPVAQPTAPPSAAPPSTVATAPVPAPIAPPVPAIRAIEVSGVVQVGGQTSIIVQEPNGTSSRSARVGDRLANGQVLVKRIDVSSGYDPVVVLEQNGVEVTHSVSLLGS